MTHEAIITPEEVSLEALAERFPISSNGAEGLLQYYGLERGGVDGTRILDLCAGGSDLTARLLRMGADATALDLRYRDKKDFLKKVKNERAQPSLDFFDSFEGLSWRYAAGSVTDIPYPDESFDQVLSFYGLFGVIDDDSIFLRKAMNEAIRVLKKGGKLQVGPLFHGVGSFGISNQKELLGELVQDRELVVTADDTLYPDEPKGNHTQLRKLIIQKVPIPQTS